MIYIFRILAPVALFVTVSFTAANADVFVINGATTTTNDGNVVDGNDQITISQSGSFLTTTNGEEALFATGNNNSLSNQGAISTDTTVRNNSLSSTGDRNVLANSGSITLTSGTGQFSSGEFNRIHNVGTIGIFGNASDGINIFGNNNQIMNSGAIEMTSNPDSDGIDVRGNRNTINNSGYVFAKGDESRGIYVLGDENGVINTGTIRASGTQVSGIRLVGDDNFLENTGTIQINGTGAVRAGGDRLIVQNSGSIFGNGTGLSTVGTSQIVSNSGSIRTTDHGISLSGENSLIENDGLIQTQGTFAYGIFFSGNGHTVTNAGVIATSNHSSTGIYLLQTGTSRVVNSGSITTKRFDSPGIYLDNANDNQIVNSGTISVEGERSDGVQIIGNRNSVTNNGLVASRHGRSISMQGKQSTLDLQAGSVLIGNLYFEDSLGSGTSDATLRFGKGMNASLTVDGALPANIHVAPGAVLTIVGNTIHVADVESFSADTLAAGDAISMIAHAVSDHQRTADSTSGKLSFAGVSEGQSWVKVFGGLSFAGSNDDDWNTQGLIFGRDIGSDLGIFFGTSVSNVYGASQSADTRQVGIFGGVYHSTNLRGLKVDTILSLGVNSNERTRDVLNSSSATGIDQFSAVYRSYNASASLNFSPDVSEPINAWSPSFGILYAALWSDSYVETGQTIGMGIEGRMSQMIELQGKLSRTLKLRAIAGGKVSAEFYGGMAARHHWGEPVNATLAGSPVRFSTFDDPSTLQGFVGLNVDFIKGSGTKIHGNIEIGRDSRDYTTAIAGLTAELNF